MNYEYPIPTRLLPEANILEEFANGGAQCHAQLDNGSIHEGLLISDARAIIAMRGHDRLPFEVDSILRLFQTEEDKSPRQRDGWAYFDSWSTRE